MEEPIYFSIDFKTRSKCEKINKEYNQGKFIGKGAYGKVYELCLKEDCKYILKVIKYDNTVYLNTGQDKLSYKSYYNRWEKEVEIHRVIEECQKGFKYTFAPHIYDAWYCIEDNEDSYFFIVMEKFDGNLYDFMNKYKNKNDTIRKLINTIVSSTLDRLNLSLDYIHKKCKICINDIKPDNILYKECKDDFLFVFADFGLSDKIQDESCKTKDIDRLTNTINIVLSEMKK